LSTEQMPQCFPMDIAVERPEEFAPGLDPDLLKLVQATAELQLADADADADEPHCHKVDRAAAG
jgi:Mn-containing catalase